MLSKLRISLALYSCCIVASFNAHAGISLSSTRLIYDGTRQEVSIIVRNTDADVLVQAWLETDTENDTGDLPFAITPTLSKLAPRQQQLLRIMYAGTSDLPLDQESLFWLNAQEIPAASEQQDTLQFAVLHRIKMFFRPANLAGAPNDAPTTLEWTVESQEGKPVMVVHNPSAYYVTLVPIAPEQAVSQETLSNTVMIAPGTRVALAPSDPTQKKDAMKLVFNSLNDYGTPIFYSVQLQTGSIAHAVALEKP